LPNNSTLYFSRLWQDGEVLSSMLKDLFKPKPKYVTIRRPEERGIQPGQPEKKELPDGLWVKCNNCRQIIYHKDLEANLKVCPKCNYHFRLRAGERIAYLFDAGSVQESNSGLISKNPLGFPEYEEKVEKARKRTGLNEGVITGVAKVKNIPCVFSVMDFGFMGGSMGSVVGEKISRAFEYAAEHNLPVVSVTAGGGGARMQEGIISLMQMAKTCQALNRLQEKGIFYLSILTDPTMGGVFASFASLGDVVIAEPGALIGFAGPRVIEQTIRQTLPPGFQRSEFLLEHGIIDLIVERKNLRETVARLLRFHQRDQVGKEEVSKDA